jgi:hypothetical protein
MQQHHIAGVGGDAIAPAAISKRNFLIAAVGVAATLPAVAFAEATAEIPQLPLPSNEEQLDACIEQLNSLLARMHSTVTKQHIYVRPTADGSYYLVFQGDVQFQRFQGDGLYEVSRDGRLYTYWLEECFQHNPSNGTPVQHLHYMATHWEDGRPCGDERKLYSPNIVRKLSEVAI